MIARFRNLPLFWKLQIPFVTLLLIVGLLGAVLIVRGLSSQATSSLESDLQRASLDARSVLLARELYLLESANLAANLEGMAAAIGAADAAETDRLLQTVLALKSELDLVSTVTASAVPLVTYLGGTPAPLPVGAATAPLVGAALNDPAAERQAGFLPAAQPTTLAIAAPVCEQLQGCAPSGVAVVGFDLDGLAQSLAANVIGPDGDGGVALHTLDGAVLAAVGRTSGQPTDVVLQPGEVVRRTELAGEEELQTLYAPLMVQGQQQGLVAVSLPGDQAFAGVQDAARRLAFVLLVALAGIVGIGAAVSRLVTNQVRPLLETNEALGRGELDARAPVVSEDEVGELAEGLNRMAEQLQASYATLESRVEQRTAEVRRLLRERTEFFAALSHELRTPLAIILSEAELLAETDDEETRESGDAISSSAAGLLSSVNDILEVARAEAGGLELQSRPIDLGEFIRDFAPTADALARRGGVVFRETIPALPEVQADPERLREIVLNLVDNAIKYTPSGGRVDVSARSDGAWVELSVADTGVGIPEEVGERLFEPFYRVRGNRPQAGQSSSGLGMALTKGLVEAHGGEIGYTSRSGAGTTFTVRLPVARPAARYRPPTAPPPPPGARLRPGGTV